MKKVFKAIKFITIAIIAALFNAITFPIQLGIMIVWSVSKQPEKIHEQMLDDAYFVFEQIYDKPYYLNEEQFERIVAAIADYQLERLDKCTCRMFSIVKWQAKKLNYAPADSIYCYMIGTFYDAARETLYEAGVTPAA